MGRFVVDRNYWSDYTTLYPNAKEIESTGVWDTPYRYDNPDSSGLSFVDNNPLVNPTNSDGTLDVDDDSNLTLLLIIVPIVVIVVVSIRLLIYSKKVQTNNPTAY